MDSKKIILFLIFSFFPLHAQLGEVEKSLILPGWGESVYGEKSRARIFYNSEFALWTSTILSGVIANYYNQTSRAYAANHAGVVIKGKDDRYWIDIGNYDTRTLYNDEHLRWREFDNIYDERSDWNWSSTARRKHFERLRIQGDKWGLAFQFFGAGLVLNRVLSAIDVVYLKNRDGNSFTVVPNISVSSLKYTIIYHF